MRRMDYCWDRQPKRLLWACSGMGGDYALDRYSCLHGWGRSTVNRQGLWMNIFSSFSRQQVHQQFCCWRYVHGGCLSRLCFTLLPWSWVFVVFHNRPHCVCNRTDDMISLLPALVAYDWSCGNAKVDAYKDSGNCNLWVDPVSRGEQSSLLFFLHWHLNLFHQRLFLFSLDLFLSWHLPISLQHPIIVISIFFDWAFVFLLWSPSKMPFEISLSDYKIIDSGVWCSVQHVACSPEWAHHDALYLFG